MINSDLVKCLRVFTKAEQDSFVLFLQSPYFTKPKDVSKELALAMYIFEIFNEQAEDADKLLAREQVYAVLYPDRPFNLQTLKNVTTLALNFAERFIEFEALKNTVRPVSNLTRQVYFFSEKFEPEIAASYLKRLERLRSERNSSEMLDFFQDWEAEHAKCGLAGLQTEIKDDMNILQALKSLEVYYWVRRLDLMLSVFNQLAWAPILDESQVKAILQETEEALKKTWLSIPLLQIHFAALQLLSSWDIVSDDLFDKYLQALKEQENTLSSYHLERLEGIAYNCCARNFKIPKYRDILLELFKRRLLPERLKKQEFVSSSWFIGMVKTGIVAKQYAFALEYIEVNRHHIIGPQASESYYQLALAYFHFSQNENSKARQLVLDLPNFSDHLCKYFSKMLEVKIFYEGGSVDQTLFDSRLNNLRMTVVRENNMSVVRKAGHNNFVRFLLRLDRLRQKPRPSKVRLQELLLDIEQEKDVNERFWLNQKINELLQKA